MVMNIETLQKTITAISVQLPYITSRFFQQLI